MAVKSVFMRGTGLDGELCMGVMIQRVGLEPSARGGSNTAAELLLAREEGGVDVGRVRVRAQVLSPAGDDAGAELMRLELGEDLKEAWAREISRASNNAALAFVDLTVAVTKAMQLWAAVGETAVSRECEVPWADWEVGLWRAESMTAEVMVTTIVAGAAAVMRAWGCGTGAGGIRIDRGGVRAMPKLTKTITPGLWRRMLSDGVFDSRLEALRAVGLV